MEEEPTLIETLVASAQDYTKSSIDLIKLKTIHKTAGLLSSVVSILIIAIAIICVIAMVNIGVALWIGQLMDNLYVGFLIVAAFYLLMAIVLFAFRKSILKTPFSNSVITHFRKDLNI